MWCAESKVCSGAKLGPLILLECQECQEAYHPLCHQPPVVDVDIYDPRFVWRCGRCIETAVIALRLKTAEKGLVRKARCTNGAIKEDENISGAKTSERKNGITVSAIMHECEQDVSSIVHISPLDYRYQKDIKTAAIKISFLN